MARLTWNLVILPPLLSTGVIGKGPADLAQLSSKKKETGGEEGNELAQGVKGLAVRLRISVLYPEPR